MKLRLVSTIIALAVVAGLTSGCVPEPTASPSPTGFATEEEAFAAAEATYRAYVDALNQVDLSDPETFEAVYAWTTGAFNADERRSLSEMHANDWTVTGESVVKRIERLQASKDLSEASLGSCADVSTVQLVDDAGVSQVSPERPSTQSTRVSLVRGSSPTGFLVADVAGAELDPPCEP